VPQCFGGKNVRYELKSKELQCTTKVTVYFPPAAEKGKVPVRFTLAPGPQCSKPSVTEGVVQKRVAYVHCS